MDEQLIFTTTNAGTITNIHSGEQSNLRQCTVGSPNSAVQVGHKYLFVAQEGKALINVYNISGPHKRESVEQRLPLPEIVKCLEVVENNNSNAAVADFDLPYLLLASTESGKLYIWELNSGILLNVKPMAHYQSITKIKSIMNGKYVITSGNDARVIIWQTMDLIEQDDPKPICILHDHSLPVTDFQVSLTHGDFLSNSGLILFTASQDSTVRCYDLRLIATENNKKKRRKVNNSTDTEGQQQQQQNDDLSQPRLIATFSLPFPINSLCLDPADRAMYLGTNNGCFALDLFYKLKNNRIVNLLQLNNEDNKSKIYSLVERIPHGIPQDSNSLYAIGQLLCDKVSSSHVTALKSSMDGTLLAIGDSMGKISITEIYSKQILKTLQPLTSGQISNGPVMNLLIETQFNDTKNQLIGIISSSSKSSSGSSTQNSMKIPTLQRIIYDKEKLGQLHDIWFQTGEPIGSNNMTMQSKIITPLNDFNGYLNNIKSQELIFQKQQEQGSTEIKTIREQTITSINPKQDTTTANKDKEIAELKKNIATLTSAYKDLRDMHEKLYEEHEKLAK
ncbi:chromatin-binding/pre-rRNA-processing protein IPI3 NDAI_0F03380 [Naumovozyma dairenensis CBS 421]|uniref:Pre-rRNA-processing protein IPI3 n=1 Tax=Naumovozyma dairenensis (strain ATCC 10597 / BCRC 20456 / CBS 421 / NBRC 0211 / NRRL Y-12639) TaxID=1071378 RepID=G0WCZ5_NAUDC|nr:hypothetical protein NDAI_0F03380 [Naumovozyma dairenensis CBS 421]CCD25656.1 hypothetical protein NDAI_0F03380 [Naumovozyma dairenensis CBS 421]